MMHTERWRRCANVSAASSNRLQQPRRTPSPSSRLRRFSAVFFRLDFDLCRVFFTLILIFAGFSAVFFARILAVAQSEARSLSTTNLMLQSQATPPCS